METRKRLASNTNEEWPKTATFSRSGSLRTRTKTQSRTTTENQQLGDAAAARRLSRLTRLLDVLDSRRFPLPTRALPA
jgi:hypothetical protein